MNFRPVAGAALLATGRGRGMARFGDTTQTFLASLAPLIAFPLAGSVILLLNGGGIGAIIALLLTVVAQLTPPVVSHALATRWGREAEWLRYATAFNWCQWAIPAAGFVLLIALQVVAGGQITERDAARVLIIGMALYGLWLHWILARHGLLLSRLRAVWLVVLVNAATVVLALSPRLLQLMFE